MNLQCSKWHGGNFLIKTKKAVLKSLVSYLFEKKLNIGQMLMDLSRQFLLTQLNNFFYLKELKKKHYLTFSWP